MIGLAAIAVWLCLTAGLSWLRSLGSGPRGRALAILGAGAIVALVWADSAGVLDSLWHRYRWTPLHAAEHQNEVWFYHLLLLARYQAIWPFFPFLALIALAERPTKVCHRRTAVES